MFRVVIMVPKTEDSHFYMDYYLSHHIPRIREIFKDLGLVKIEVDDGIASAMPGQPAPYTSISFFTFTTLEGFQAGFMSDGTWIMGNVPNYSSLMPEIQMNRIFVEN